MKKSVVRHILILICWMFIFVALGAVYLTLDNDQKPIAVDALTIDAEIGTEDCVYGQQKHLIQR